MKGAALYETERQRWMDIFAFFTKEQ